MLLWIHSCQVRVEVLPMGLSFFGGTPFGLVLKGDQRENNMILLLLLLGGEGSILRDTQIGNSKMGTRLFGGSPWCPFKEFHQRQRVLNSSNRSEGTLSATLPKPCQRPGTVWDERTPIRVRFLLGTPAPEKRKKNGVANKKKVPSQKGHTQTPFSRVPRDRRFLARKDAPAGAHSCAKSG